MELKDVLFQMMARNQTSSQLTDLRIGTVTQTDPLEITINTAMAPLQSGVLYLTSAVIEKKIPVLSHYHTAGDSVTSTALNDIACMENGAQLPVTDGYIILNRGLLIGDKVLLLRVQHGQKFIVLSRIYEVN